MADIKFEMPKSKSSIIKVFGIGGGGSNAVNHMYNQGITGVDFVICNTDSQALDNSPIPNKIQLGASLTEGRGAGSIPEVGKNAALENIEDIKAMLQNNTKMVFITAGMGGGTGTGAAPVIAKTARDMGILTVGIVTIPFSFEGRKRKLQADAGIEEMRQYVDSLLLINNDKVRELYGNLRLGEAFSMADNILTIAAKGIAEIITVTGYINVDFEDVKTVMKESGVAIMGSGSAEGENRSIKAVQEALSSPLLNDSHIQGARNILLYISSGDEEIRMDEVTEITDYIQEEAGMTADIIWGNGTDPSLGNCINVTVIATGFESGPLNKEVKLSSRTVSLEVEEPKVEPIDELHDIKISVKPQELYDDISHQDEPKQRITLSLDDDPQNLPDGREIQFNNEGPQFKNEIKNQIQTEELRPQQKEERISPLQERSQDRIEKLKSLNFRFNSNDGLSELENQPAYVRRGVILPEVKPSDESIVSRYTLSEGEDHKPEIRQNNSFLHDNVD